ncbi:zinc finger protein 148-like isoform X2 [Portunus trituberculatus]|uniref:zinc finger protein 148-like isoform X2 n=1 Tax=Portunus trituberculatus TaxID=210409 RepID=UPI001E1D19E5|nr:zinc finger protein 148-like isoform X2 [Portunus trituberculatus]XP_045139129.1 zinc finger protein 148-like isoform X2 [Portunus trituberculatus]XP_045139130.1 zinc finger protein 148-like isoform X2 [Portunus trituberculatus]
MWKSCSRSCKLCGTRTSPGDHPVLMFPDAPPTAMEQLLNFMYLGQTDLTSAELDQLLDLAEDLRIIGLMDSSNNSHDQCQTSVNQEVKKEKAVGVKNKRAANVKRRSAAAAGKKTPKKVTKIKNQTSSVKQKVTKDHAAADNDQGRARANRAKGASTGGKRPKKTTVEKILQDKEKNTSVKSIIAKESGKNKDEQILHVCQICQQEFKTADLHKAHMKLHYEKCLLSCPECPFKALSSAVMNQHINKHSMGKPYICPHCQMRHPLIELHIAHQKRNHPKMEVVVNKSPLVKLEKNVDTGREPRDIYSVKHTNQSSWSRAYLASLLGPVQQTCSKKQTVSQPFNILNDDSSVFNHAEVLNEKQDSVIKTEMPQQAESVSENEMPPKVEPVSRNEMPPQAEPVSRNQMPLHAEPVSRNEMPLQAEPMSRNQMPLQAEPVSRNEMLLQEQPAAKTELSLETESATKTVVSFEAESASKTEMSSEAWPLSQTEVSQKTETVAKMKMQLEAEHVVKNEMLQQVEPLAKTEMLPQQSKTASSKLSTLQSTDSFTLSTSPSVSTSTTKRGRKRKLSALGGKVSSNHSDTNARRKSPRLQREKS